MAEQWHLRRVDYRTDATDADPEYRGSFAGNIPARALTGGQQIVAVDWSERGWVTVTYLAPGPAPFAQVPAPTPEPSACGERVNGGRCVMAAGHDGPHGQVGLR